MPTPGDRQPRRTLVTGGAGFIGSHLVERLLARGDDVTVVDDLSTGRDGNLRHARALAAAGPGRLRVRQGDLAAALPALASEEPFAEIYHLAAAVGVDLVMREPVRAIEVNVEQTAGLLRFARAAHDAGAGTALLLTSSSEVYGKPTRRVFSEDDDVVYGPTPVTRWSYACAKALDEYLALGHARDGLPVVIARLFNTVGPRQVGRYGMVLPRFVAAAARGETLRVFGDGSQTRCFCDVRDVAAALPRLLAEPACRGRVFNVGSDEPTSIADLARLVIRVLKSPSAVELVPYDRAYPAGYEDLQHRRPDLSRVRAAVGFEPSVPLERTIADIASEQAEQESAPSAAPHPGPVARPHAADTLNPAHPPAHPPMHAGGPAAAAARETLP